VVRTFTSDPPQSKRGFSELGTPLDWIRRALAPTKWEPPHSVSGVVVPPIPASGRQWMRNVTRKKGSTVTTAVNNQLHNMITWPTSGYPDNAWDMIITHASVGQAVDAQFRLGFGVYSSSSFVEFRALSQGYTIRDMDHLALGTPVLIQSSGDTFGFIETDLAAGTCYWHASYVMVPKGEPLENIGQLMIP